LRWTVTPPPSELFELLSIEISILRHRHDRHLAVELDRPEHQRLHVVTNVTRLIRRKSLHDGGRR
jgi:hypothetical protein